MSEEIEAKIEEEADWYGSAGTGGTPKSHFKDGAGFGYQLAQDHFKKFTLLKLISELREELIRDCQPWYICCVAIERRCNELINRITSESKEPKQ